MDGIESVVIGLIMPTAVFFIVIGIVFFAIYEITEVFQAIKAGFVEIASALVRIEKRLK